MFNKIKNLFKKKPAPLYRLEDAYQEIDRLLKSYHDFVFSYNKQLVRLVPRSEDEAKFLISSDFHLSCFRDSVKIAYRDESELETMTPDKSEFYKEELLRQREANIKKELTGV